VKHDNPLEAVDAPLQQVLGMSFASNQHPMWIFDRTSHVFLDVNDAALRQYGYSRQEFLSMSIVDLLQDQSGFALDLLRAPRTAEQYIHRAKNGNVFPVAITSWQFILGGSKAELVVGHPVDSPRS
jgi:PAS domain S-box-containing protein